MLKGFSLALFVCAVALAQQPAAPQQYLFGKPFGTAPAQAKPQPFFQPRAGEIRMVPAPPRRCSVPLLEVPIDKSAAPLIKIDPPAKPVPMPHARVPAPPCRDERAVARPPAARQP